MTDVQYLGAVRSYIIGIIVGEYLKFSMLFSFLIRRQLLNTELKLLFVNFDYMIYLIAFAQIATLRFPVSLPLIFSFTYILCYVSSYWHAKKFISATLYLSLILEAGSYNHLPYYSQHTETGPTKYSAHTKKKFIN